MPIRLLALVAFIPLLQACSMPYRTPEFVASNGATTIFPGIADYLKDSVALDLLLVHGMCTHNEKWAKSATQSIYAAMGGDPMAVKLTPVDVGTTGIELYQQELALAQGSVRVNAIVWSPLTAKLKRQLCYDKSVPGDACKDEGSPVYPYIRASVNKALKDTLLDDCLSDAMIYQGQARTDINLRMQQAVVQAVATSGGQAKPADMALKAATVPKEVPLVVLTDSLGSKVTFDAIYKLSQGSAAGERISERVAHVFMSANQLPLLSLADRQLDGTQRRPSSPFAPSESMTAFPVDPLAALLEQRRVRARADIPWAMPHVVAFTDPNDLLSFLLGPSRHVEDLKYPVVDVVVSNDNTYFGLVELPITAHLDYDKNKSVLDLIACGNPRSAQCKAR